MLIFNFSNFVDAIGMSATFKLACQPNLRDISGKPWANVRGLKYNHCTPSCTSSKGEGSTLPAFARNEIPCATRAGMCAPARINVASCAFSLWVLALLRNKLAYGSLSPRLI